MSISEFQGSDSVHKYNIFHTYAIMDSRTMFSSSS